MARRQTIRERFHGKPPIGSEALIALWNEALVNKLLRAVWSAYDELHESFLSKLPWDEDYDNLEESITEEFELAIRRHLDSFLPVDVQHGPSERESRLGGSAKAPEYDIAFVWRGDPRLMWPLEAKVLKSDANTVSNLGDYIDTIQNRYLNCIYAPFSSGGAMISYLRSGNPELVTSHLKTRLGVPLAPNVNFPNRYHSTSEHHRVVPKGKEFPIKFRIHHLVMPLYVIELHPDGKIDDAATL